MSLPWASTRCLVSWKLARMTLITTVSEANWLRATISFDSSLVQTDFFANESQSSTISNLGPKNDNDCATSSYRTSARLKKSSC